MSILEYVYSNHFIFIFYCGILPKILHFLHEFFTGAIIVRKFIDNVILISCVFCIRVIGERKLLHLFIEKIDVVSKTHDRHREGHNSWQKRVRSNSIVYISEWGEDDEGDCSFECLCEMFWEEVTRVDEDQFFKCFLFELVWPNECLDIAFSLRLFLEILERRFLWFWRLVLHNKTIQINEQIWPFFLIIFT